eukprot:GHVR01153773.1.p1 GENE.GHVR01153773.1~~GHVR01153773.1.p1  ORF type:complete len:367 (+),score=-4.92 GHVR01153773.1:24-1124(+)
MTYSFCKSFSREISKVHLNPRRVPFNWVLLWTSSRCSNVIRTKRRCLYIIFFKFILFFLYLCILIPYIYHVVFRWKAGQFFFIYLSHWSLLISGISLLCSLGVSLVCTQKLRGVENQTLKGNSCNTQGDETGPAVSPMSADGHEMEGRYEFAFVAGAPVEDGPATVVDNGSMRSKTQSCDDGNVKEFMQPWYAGASWVFQSLSIPLGLICMVVFNIFFYATLPTEKLQSLTFLDCYFNILPHGPATFLNIADFLFVSYLPFRFAHVVYGELLGLLYAVFTILYYFGGGISDHGKTIYDFLDWGKPLVPIIFMVLLVLVVVPLLYFFMWWLIWRVRDSRGKHASQLRVRSVDQEEARRSQVSFSESP